MRKHLEAGPPPAEDKDEHLEKAFMASIEMLRSINEELAGQWEERLDGEIESGAMTVAEAAAKVDDVIQKRGELRTAGRLISSSEKAESVEVATGGRATLEQVLESANDASNFLGDGNVAEVYHVNGSKQVCAKIVKRDREMYQKSNSIHKERQFLDDVRDIKVLGARAPKAYASIAVDSGIVMLMEELPASSLQMVMDGKAFLPETFSAEDFFEAVLAYVQELHRQGIYHRDIAPRNIMVDNITGTPYVIDFGRSKSKFDIMGEDFDRLSTLYEESDTASVREAKLELMAKVSKQSH